MNKKWLFPLTSTALLFIIWEAACRILKIPLFILPRPTQVLEALVTNRKVLWGHSLVTLKEALIGLIIAVIVAFFVALLMDASSNFKLAIYPQLVVSQTIPVMVLGPLFSIWFGFGLAPKILMVILMCFFPIVISFADALAQVNQKQINLLKTFGAKRWQIYHIIKIPEALPGLFSGLKVASTYCVGGAIVGEWLSASAGLGFYMIRVKNGYLLDKVFATVVVIILLSLLLNGSVQILERICVKKNRHKKISKGAYGK